MKYNVNTNIRYCNYIFDKFEKLVYMRSGGVSKKWFFMGWSTGDGCVESESDK